MLTSEHPEPHTVLQQSSTPNPCTVCTKQQSLSPQEIERICKAFIKLLLAKETHPHGDGNQSNTNI